MDWQSSADTVPSALIPPEQLLSLGKPPVSGAWRDGDPVGRRSFASIGALALEAGGELPAVRIAYETWGTLSPAADNVVLVPHAMTGDSHVAGPAGPGHRTPGWWDDIVGPGRAIDTDRFFVVAPNVLGGCQGSTGPSGFAPDGREWGSRFPYLTVRDQAVAILRLLDELGLPRVAALVGGSMGGMHVLELAALDPARFASLAVLASTAATTADQIALNAVQLDAIRTDEAFEGGDYYDSAEGPHRGLALARRIALISYRSADEINARFGRAAQSRLNPIGRSGRFAVESYLDFHGNRFTRRFDANSYLCLTEAMNSHDVGRDRGGVEAALSRIDAPSLVLGVTSDRLFPLADQRRIARALPGNVLGDDVVEIDSEFGHDGFLIESAAVADALRTLLRSV
ncbi:homoserine O-acetyltransferase MetX [Mycetocola reblochoni]|uniref:Homoserine O-acetyltransferase n=2 Tax=Mycetocola reblochoni TaxID=331618 RepID=A0A1R4JST8_9MICO|nr:homoserine O-acetyltransferase [Mycetocola reblochoni]RLP70421.1 homoserine O-acetyltransferase [Mycetocola reblochoni]SJN35086.1 Homoserine O-acetyltransferase [Mycetocola reblochoni REB411]